MPNELLPNCYMINKNYFFNYFINHFKFFYYLKPEIYKKFKKNYNMWFPNLKWYLV